uniref:GAG-pre-integrase domain-containing protein n=1 Tax=Chenopodium quinoa TaxID=63459 RepID=A0A803LHF5_CHEQI
MGSTGTVDTTHPLYLHPSEGANSVNISKLTSSSDYRMWRRSMEIALSSKRKLGFVTGTVVKDPKDSAKAEMWNTCNDMVISWIFASVSDTVKKSIMFFRTAREMWLNLEQRFSVVNGSRKYKLSKQLYECKQLGMPVNEYYTNMSVLWEELESLNQLPVFTTYDKEIDTFLKELNAQKEEQKLFQFLNGLDDDYGPQRSNLLMMTPLPTADIASCGKAGHTAKKCWYVVGFPKWHPKARSQQKGKGKLDQMIKMLPNPTKQASFTSETDDELDNNFAGMVSCNSATVVYKEWIIDSGASDHMTTDLHKLVDPVRMCGNTKINLPNGDTTTISHVGSLKLKSGLTLKNVLCVPEFKHNLLSVNKLVAQDGCKPIELILSKLNELAKENRVNVSELTQSQANNAHLKMGISNIGAEQEKFSKAVMWHHRLGHAPLDRIKSAVNLSKEDMTKTGLYGVKPTYKEMRSFGCLAIAYNPKKHKDKMKERGVLCLFLGYPLNKKGYRLLNLFTNSTFVSRDVKFHEHIYPYSLPRDELKKLMPEDRDHDIGNPRNGSIWDEPLMNVDQEEVTDDVIHVIHSDEDSSQIQQSTSSQIHASPRKSTRPTKKPSWMDGYQVGCAIAEPVNRVIYAPTDKAADVLTKVITVHQQNAPLRKLGVLSKAPHQV